MPSKVVLIGHCGPDSSYLRMAIMAAQRDAQVLLADDEASLESLLKNGVDLLLLNRVIEWGFLEHSGSELIRRLKKERPDLRMMLVSNYEDAQADAVAAGALRGFGKRDLGTPRVAQIIRDALQDVSRA